MKIEEHAALNDAQRKALDDVYAAICHAGNIGDVQYCRYVAQYALHALTSPDCMLLPSEVLVELAALIGERERAPSDN